MLSPYFVIDGYFGSIKLLTSAASSFWLSYLWGGNAALLCGDGPNLAYSSYNSIGYPISNFPQICLHFLFGIWGKDGSNGSSSNFCQGSRIATHLPPTCWLVSSVNTQRVQHFLGSRLCDWRAAQPSLSDVLNTAHALQSCWAHTVCLENLQNASYFQGTFNQSPNLYFYPSYAQGNTANPIVSSPKRHQNSLVSDQNIIPFWHGTGKMRFFLQKLPHHINLYNDIHRWRNPWIQGPDNSNIINISWHLFTYLTSTLMGQPVGFSIHIDSQNIKLPKWTVGTHSAHYYYIHHGIKIFNTWDTQEGIHVVQTDRIIPRSCLYPMAQELELKNKASTYILLSPMT